MVLSNIYSDGMILQRNAENIIEGTTLAGDKVNVVFDNEEYETTADKDGCFLVKLKAMAAGGPFFMTLKDSAEERKISDIYVGDVFLLEGQSNMELPVSRTLDLYADEVGKKDYPLIRMFQLPKDYKFGEPDKTMGSGEWIGADIKNVMNFSALGFYFAEIKYNADSVPIGLVHAAVGGTHIEAFMSEKQVLETGAKMRKIAEIEGRSNDCICLPNDSCKACYEAKIKRNKDTSYINKITEQELKNIDAWNKRLDANDRGLAEGWQNAEWTAKDLEDSVEIDVPSSWIDNPLGKTIGSVWVQTTVDVPKEFSGKKVQLRLGTIVDADRTFVNGKLVGQTEYFYPPRRYMLDEDVLVEGKNVITVRVIVNNNVGEFKKDMPYCIKMGDKEISLEGKWHARIAANEIPQGQMHFFTWQPTALYNTMIYPIRNIRFDSVLFYQGESNTRYPEDYEYLMTDMVKEQRELFGYNVPFMFAKLPYFKGETWEVQSDDWDRLREAQERAVKSMDNATIVELYDLGQYNEIHIQNKKEAAERFYLKYLSDIKNER